MGYPLPLRSPTHFTVPGVNLLGELFANLKNLGYSIPTNLISPHSLQLISPMPRKISL